MPSEKGIAHILVLLILIAGLGATLYLSQKNQIFKPRAFETVQQDEITNLTNQLLSSKNSDEIRRIASQRKEALLKEAKSNPQAFLDHATLASERSSFPSEIQPFIEEEKTVQGNLIVFHQDDFENNKSTYFYRLKDATGKNYDLHFTNQVPAILSDSVVRVEGTLSQDQLVTDKALQVLEPFSIPDDREKRIAVVLLKYPSNQTDPFSKEEIRRFMFSNEKGFRSVRNWYRQNSSDLVRLSGEVFGFYTITPDVDPDSIYPNRPFCDDEHITQQAGKELLRDNVSLDSYDIVVYNAPRTPNCRYSFANVGGKPATTFIFERNIPQFNILLHELGHNMGVNHASSFYCYPRAIDISRNCQYQEYGDLFDIMGGGYIPTQNTYYFNTPHKVAMGWIPPDRIKTVTQSGEYQVCTSEYAMNCPQALKILKYNQADVGVHYYLGYRQPWLEDSTLPDGITRGVSIHMADGDFPARTELIDTTPEIADSLEEFKDQALGDGTTFNDEINQIQITQLHHDQWSVTVRINLPASPPNLGYTYPTPQ